MNFNQLEYLKNVVDEELSKGDTDKQITLWDLYRLVTRASADINAMEDFDE